MNAGAWGYTLILLCGVTSVTSSSNNNDYTEYPKINKAYKVYINPKIWIEALIHCYSENATLAMPLTTREVNTIKDMVRQYTPDKLPAMTFKTFYLLGFLKYNDYGDYVTLDGKPLRNYYYIWNNIPERVIGEFVVSIKHNGLLDDFPNNTPGSYICQKELTRKNDYYNEKCNVEHVGYVYDDVTGQCYKVHKNSLVWYRAEQVCRSEGSHLAVINSEEEQAAVVDIMKNSLLEGDNRRIFKNYAFIGFQDILKEGYYLTVFNRPIAETGYVEWSAHVDEDNAAHKDCGVLRVDGLGYEKCDERNMFICERKIHETLSPVLGISPRHNAIYTNGA